MVFVLVSRVEARYILMCVMFVCVCCLIEIFCVCEFFFVIDELFVSFEVFVIVCFDFCEDVEW